VTRIPPPLLGYNNNVSHLGRTFHIQTEDSGIKYARIITHLFIDGGRIVKSIKTEYKDVLGKPDMTETVRRMMKDQHKSMFLSLRSGAFDELIDRVARGEPPPPAEPVQSQVPRLRADSLPSMSLGPNSLSLGFREEPRTAAGGISAVDDEKSAVPAKPASVRRASTAPVPQVEPRVSTAPRPEPRQEPGASPKRGARRRSSLPPPPIERQARHVDKPASAALVRPDPGAPSASSGQPPRVGPSKRPAAKAATEPRSQSIFGENAEAKQSLDEVILSFLEDEEP
jgi:hypothetical protein